MESTESKARGSQVRLRGATQAKEPLQERSRLRVRQVLDAAGELVLEGGMEAVTIANVSERSGVGRASIYQFFPSVFAILNALAGRYLDELEQHRDRGMKGKSFQTLADVSDYLIDSSVEFYDANPAAQAVLLGGDGKQEIRVADKGYDRRIAEFTATRFGSLMENYEAADPKYLRVAVTLVTSICSLSVWEEGRITDFYREQAKLAARGYLQLLTDQ